MSSTEPADVPQRILDQAARLFVARGYAGISMREIAEAVGLSKAGLYYHFADKEALFLAILTANLEQIAGSITAARAEGDTTRYTTRQRITGLLRGIFEQAPEQRAVIRLANQELAQLSQAAQVRFGLLYQEKFIGQVAAILQEGMARGEVRPLDAQTATWLLLGLAYPFFYPAHPHAGGAESEIVDLLVGVFFDGIGA